MERKITDIKIGERIRKNLGDLSGLTESIRELGVLQPVVITAEGLLIGGRRRLEAARQAGLKNVPVHVAADLTEAVELLKAEAAENLFREPFSPAEAEEYQRRLTELEKPAARKRQKEAGAKGKEGGRGKKKNPSSNLEEGFGRSNKENPSPNLGESNHPAGTPQVSSKLEESNHRTSRETNRRAAAPTGFSATTLDKVKEIREKAEEDPEGYADLYEKLQKPGARVDGIHKEMQKRAHPPPPPLPSPRGLSFGVIARPDKRTEAQVAQVSRLREIDPVAGEVVGLVEGFAALVRRQSSTTLAEWQGRAVAGSSIELRRFAEGLSRDQAAVEAAVEESWSNGPVEGHINRLKTIKRQMYGRAGLALLGARVRHTG
jgi:hypothetical protein